MPVAYTILPFLEEKWEVHVVKQPTYPLPLFLSRYRSEWCLASTVWGFSPFIFRSRASAERAWNECKDTWLLTMPEFRKTA